MRKLKICANAMAMSTAVLTALSYYAAASAATQIVRESTVAQPSLQRAQRAPWWPARKSRERVLYSFSTGADGGFPDTSLVEGSGGVLYGTTVYGGTGGCNGVYPGCGTVFQMTPSRDGYRESVIYDFPPNSGSYPNGLMITDNGSLYGTTSDYLWPPVLFGLTPTGKKFTEHLEYQFPENIQPWDPPMSGPDGALYGVVVGDAETYGQIVRYALDKKGAKESVVYAFKGGLDGITPEGPVVFDKSGAIYGATAEGGGSGCLGNGCGTIFKLTPGASGYAESVLYRFTGGPDGSFPHALIEDKHGHLFGAASHGGVQACSDGGCGNVYEFDPVVQKLTVLCDFVQDDLWLPDSKLVMSPDGVLYGTTSQYSPTFGFGGVFAVTPTSSGYVESDVHIFAGNPTDGYFPRGGLILNKAGKLFGTTYWGGTYNNGSVYEITP